MEDEAIIKLVLDGHTHAFSEIVDRYRNDVYGMAFRFVSNPTDVQDISQEIFIKVFKNLHMYNGASKFSTWLFRLGYNHCIDWLRRNSRHRDLKLMQEDSQMADSRAGPEELLLEKARRDALRKAVDALKERYRKILILHYYQGLSYEEIGEILDMPLKTVETRLYRARKQLGEKLAGDLSGGGSNEV